MKKIVLFFVFMFLPSVVFSGTWCQWSGSEGINCKSTSRAYITLNDHNVSVSAENLNPRGWYELITTQPTIGADQVRDAEVWGFVANQITKTWTVRDMTATEIDEEIANPMSITDYYLWKALLVTGTITQAQAVASLPSEMIDAYQARKRLLGD